MVKRAQPGRRRSPLAYCNAAALTLLLSLLPLGGLLVPAGAQAQGEPPAWPFRPHCHPVRGRLMVIRVPPGPADSRPRAPKAHPRPLRRGHRPIRAANIRGAIRRPPTALANIQPSTPISIRANTQANTRARAPRSAPPRAWRSRRRSARPMSSRARWCACA